MTTEAQQTYDVLVQWHEYPDPDFLETGRKHIAAVAVVMENAEFFTGDNIQWGRVGENGYQLVKTLYDQLGARVLKAGATRDAKNRDHFRATGVTYAKLVEFEQHWAKFHQDLADLGTLRVAAEAQAAEDPDPIPETPKPGRRRRRRGGK